MIQKSIKLIDGFKQFVLRGNVVDLAVGVVIGTAFGKVVTALVENVLTPFIGAIAKVPDFSDLTFTINGSKFMYGNFINALISFILVAAAIYFFVITPINTLIAKTKKEKPIDLTTKKCNKCFSEIHMDATKCAFCTADLV